MMEDGCGGEVSPTKSGENDQQFGSTSQVLAPSSSSPTACGGIESWILSYGFFLENAVNEDNIIVEQSVPNCGIASEDDNDVTDGSGEKTLTELLIVPDDNFEGIENQEFQDPQDSNINGERQCSESNFCGEPPPIGDVELVGGVRSPCSSQGTSSSIRNLFNEREGIEERASKINEILQAECTGVYEKLHQMIKGHFSDDHATKRFLSHCIKDVMCTSFYKGVCQPNSDEAEKLESEFEKLASMNTNKLLGMVGKVLLEKYCASSESGQSQGYFSEEMDTLEIDNNSIAVNEKDVIQVESGQFHEQNFENKVTLDIKPNLVKGLPSIPDYIPAVEGGEPSNFKKPRKLPTVKKVRVSDEEIWNAANDAKKEHEKNKDRQVEKIGIVFYEDIFTEIEKRSCTASGKNNTAKFDKTKLRFIRAAIAFILADPERRCTKAFEKARNQPDFVDLTKGQYDTFKKRVLTEYAYRQRKKIVN